MRERRIRAGAIDFVALEEGTGPLALCLHGFPDTAHTWRHLLPALASAGFHAVAPFMRGYAPTGLAPDGRYEPMLLGRDANALHEALGADDNAVLIGHDWGAGATYLALLGEPHRWRRAVALSVPPLAQSLDLASPAQMRRSWYSFALQALPTADAVATVAADDFAFLAGLWADWSPGYDATLELAAVKQALADPAHLAAALAYYPGAPSRVRPYEEIARSRELLAALSTPLLYVHGENCGCIGVDVLELGREYFPPNMTVQRLPAAGHFVHLERPTEVNGMIVDFLAG